jgi:hypothetical protein
LNQEDDQYEPFLPKTPGRAGGFCKAWSDPLSLDNDQILNMMLIESLAHFETWHRHNDTTPAVC